jgi:hypothetical protein
MTWRNNLPRRWVRNMLVIGAIASVTSSAYAYGESRVPPQAHRATYALQSDLWSYPYTLKLRHCAPAEDTLSDLRMVRYDPAHSVVIYRCVPD